MELLEMKSLIPEVNNSWDGSNIILDLAKENFCELK